jgi:hypothetical protein
MLAAVPNKALALEAGAVNVTLALATGLPVLSLTVTTRGAAKVVLIGAV